MTEKTHYDVVIIGGGMAGWALACGLAETALKILVVDSQLPQSPNHWGDSFDPRVSAITCASENILRSFGAWEFISSCRIAPYTDMDVWDGSGTGNIQFHSDETGVDYLGHIIENRVIQHSLYQASQQHKNISYRQATLKELTPIESGWQVQLSDGDLLEPLLVVGADGARSQVREQAEFNMRSWAYDHTAIVTTIVTEKSHDNVARQSFLETGPLGVLPLRKTSNDQHSCVSSIVWSAEEPRAQALMAMDDQGFNRALTRALEGRLGNVIKSDQRFSFPLIQRHATDYIQSGVVLIADAAHTLHPLAGQGINMGFLDAAVLAEEIGSNITKGLPANEVLALRRYQRRRKGHNLAMMSAMEVFKRLFEQQKPPLRILRNAGMRFLNKHAMAKREMVSHAMGLSGDLPAIAQRRIAEF